ncbi:hypothetical protein PSHT_03347 [Puccinia striiformis]|uniref:Uncharacterized protein n=2 Tax=Puccinia striiformis TaxID=27350 RepID=A0A0L0UXW9_9BASI|nr:hypothetical protein PSTG_14980 [Puccinia striiformis f. sp. tritici PST-78]POW20632.1 hypothetical protein PSHT_03347 [Puccinia striiformis]
MSNTSPLLNLKGALRYKTQKVLVKALLLNEEGDGGVTNSALLQYQKQDLPRYVKGKVWEQMLKPREADANASKQKKRRSRRRCYNQGAKDRNWVGLGHWWVRTLEPGRSLGRFGLGTNTEQPKTVPAKSQPTLTVGYSRQPNRLSATKGNGQFDRVMHPNLIWVSSFNFTIPQTA